MKAMVKVKAGEGNLQYIDVPEPQPGEGEVKIKIAYAGICGSDIKFYHWTQRPGLRVPIPVILGHEFSGTVEAVGKGVTKVKVGDRVTAEPARYICGKCDHCVNGDPLFCQEKQSVGLQTDGAFAEYLCTREAIVHKIPDQVSLEAAAMTEPACVSMRCVYDHGHIIAGDTVVVFGPGTIGLLCMQLSKASGARVVLVGTQRDETRFEAARALGVDVILYAEKDDVVARVMELTHGRGADTVIECSGAIQALDSAARCLKKRGTILTVGIFKPGPLEISTLNTIVNNEISLRGSYGSKHHNWVRALEMMERGLLRMEPLITHRLPLSEADQGFAFAENLTGIKILLNPQSSG